MQPNFIVSQSFDSVNVVMEEITELTLGDLCRACQANTDIIIELVNEGVIEITQTEQNFPQQDWRFTGLHLHRAKVAMRLQRDLGVNFAGAALVLQLLDELDEVKSKLRSTVM